MNRRSPKTSWRTTRAWWGLATGLALFFACAVLLVRLWSSEVPAGSQKGVSMAAVPQHGMAQSEAEPVARQSVAPAPSAIAASTSRPPAAPKAVASNVERAPVSAQAVVPTEDEQAPGRPSHPITSDRQRIYRENNLNAALMGAMNVGDHQGLRALIEEYRLDYPKDTHRLQEGYTLVADCLEKLTAERQAKARQYWKAKRGSPVRRFIRQHCLAGGTGSAEGADLPSDTKRAPRAG